MEEVPAHPNLSSTAWKPNPAGSYIDPIGYVDPTVANVGPSRGHNEHVTGQRDQWRMQPATHTPEMEGGCETDVSEWTLNHL